MRLGLMLAFCTWLLAFVLRGLAKAYLESLENPRTALRPPLSWLSLGWLGNSSGEVPVMAALGVLVLVLAITLAWWRLRPSRLAAASLGLFTGGAVANMSEHLAYGTVTDYIPVSWPADYMVNFADLAVLAGTFLLAPALLHSLVMRYRRRRSIPLR